MSLTSAAMFAVTAMHEEVHERAREQKQKRKNAEQVRPMFCQKEEADDGQKDDQHHGSSRAKPTVIS